MNDRDTDYNFWEEPDDEDLIDAYLLYLIGLAGGGT